MELKLGIGIDNLIFGMEQSEIKSIIGEPDEQKSSEEDIFKFFYTYNQQKIHLSFYNLHADKFSYIKISNEELSYN